VQSWHGNRLVKFIFVVTKTWNAPWHLGSELLSFSWKIDDQMPIAYLMKLKLCLIV